MTVYGLLGEKLTHSFSPQIHSLLAAYDYRLFEVEPRHVDAFLTKRDFEGINVTIPYKKTVIPYCDTLSDQARRIGSVNTILRKQDGSLAGYNTDYDGFDRLLAQTAFDSVGKKALILGSGGSSVTIKTVLEDRHAGEIVIISRTGEHNYQNLHLHRDAALIVNTTPVGMYPHNGVSPIDLDGFPACEAVIDIIYNPAHTKLLLDAQARGIPCVNGLLMLVAQAKRAAELFTGAAIEDGIIAEITGHITRQTQNIVLIGMPGSGKSTVGTLLAKATGRELLDTDTLVEIKTGRPIPAIIEQDGIAAFRRLETEALSEASKRSGMVIATGGGIVTVPENLPLIRQNSVCVFLNRTPDKLVTQGRPLSIQYGVETLYRERLPLYQAWCDLDVDNNQNIHNVIQSIREALAL